jgi:hypothetical protein
VSLSICEPNDAVTSSAIFLVSAWAQRYAAPATAGTCGDRCRQINAELTLFSGCTRANDSSCSFSPLADQFIEGSLQLVVRPIAI